MARVLIIEDEILLRAAMVRGVGKMPGISVAEAATFGEALEAIDGQPPQMIVSDIDLPDRSGVELLGELGRRGLHIPILFVSAYLKAYAAQIPRHADVDVREKPLRLEELRAIIESRVASGATEEAPFAPADYLQLACLGHRSVVIEVETATERGHISVHDGTLWTAADTHGTGPEAFRRLAFLAGASVRVRGLRDDPGRRTITGNWEQVLLDAAREIDEASVRSEVLEVAPHAQRGAPPSAPQAVPPPPPRAPAPTLPTGMDALPKFFEEVLEEPEPEIESGPVTDPADLAFEAAFDEGVDALLRKDYGAAYAAFARAADIHPDDPKVKTNLERLRQMGHGPTRPQPS